MSHVPVDLHTLVWVTRGRSWGFRFLLTGGLSDPLPEYERLFADLVDEPAACRRIEGKVALRFPDPLTRRDAAGRVIPHEFIVSGVMGESIDSVAAGQTCIWRLVAAAYELIWDADRPPDVSDLHLSS